MKNILLIFLMLTGSATNTTTSTANHLDKLKIVLIRHGEKPLKGDNLNCKGLNRAMQLPQVIITKFGVPDHVYVPAMGLGETTSHARMFQTITPLAAKYNLKVNTAYQEDDHDQIAADLKTQTGTALICWEHKAIPSIIRALGVNATDLIWPEDDFDTIYIITFHKGIPTLTKDKENLNPSDKCSF